MNEDEVWNLEDLSQSVQDESQSVDSSKSGNIRQLLESRTTDKKKRVSSKKRWRFTLNNYTNEDVLFFQSLVYAKSNYLVFGFEVGEECGTPHLQGYVEFKKECRPIETFKTVRTCWLKADKGRDWNYNYCTKDKNFWCNGTLTKPLKLLNPDRFYEWQREIWEICNNEPDDRKIYWYWEPTGNKGKSALVKLLVAKQNACILSSKASDMKYGIVKFFEKRGYYPTNVIIDIPRSVDINYFSYTGIEEIKNGCFFSSKYECDQIVFNSPNIIILSNETPDEDKMSKDRWVIKRISMFGTTEKKVRSPDEQNNIRNAFRYHTDKAYKSICDMKDKILAGEEIEDSDEDDESNHEDNSDDDESEIEEIKDTIETFNKWKKNKH
jgi:hypothetical protein